MNDRESDGSTHRVVLKAAFEAFNRRDFDVALGYLTEDVTWVPFLARAETPLLRGKREVRKAWARQFEVLDLRLDSWDVVAEDDTTVVLDVHMAGRGHGSDVAVSQRFAQVCTFAGGLVSGVESFATVEDALQSCGLG